MIAVKEAIELIRRHTAPLPATERPLAQAAGQLLAADVFAPIDVPSFHQSAMDGYAFRYADLLQSGEFLVAGEVAAGDDGRMAVPPKQAVRIFTGAPVPAELDTVVMQEKTRLTGHRLTVLDEAIKQGSNVRRRGDEIREGTMALPKGTLLTPAAIGFLASLGYTSATVLPTPAVSVIVTGKELQTPGSPLLPGQVYESNSAMLQAALRQLGIQNITIIVSTDDAAEIELAAAKAVASSDLVLLTGGVSVGKYDFVVEACARLGAVTLFHKVAQRPGKPLYCARKEGKLLFGLPGNPASVLTCFYNFVVPAIEELTGRQDLLHRKWLPLFSGFLKKIPLTQFLKARHSASGVEPLPAQESFRLSSFSLANCLIILPEESREFVAGEKVETLLLPYL